MKDNPYLPKTCVLGIVMAKQTSVRLTNKNIADICGNPMFSYPIDTLKRSGICRRVIVSTDSQEYADLAMQHNADDAVLEDVTLQSPRWGIMSYVADATRRKYEKRCGIAFTHLAWIGGTLCSPCRRGSAWHSRLSTSITTTDCTSEVCWVSFTPRCMPCIKIPFIRPIYSICHTPA